MQKENAAMWETEEENEAREVGQKHNSEGTWLYFYIFKLTNILFYSQSCLFLIKSFLFVF